MKFHSIAFFLFLGISVSLYAQDPLRLKEEVTSIVAGDSAVKNKDIILFTGSSSIRFWKDVAAYFPGHNVLNRGFGGSEMSDLLYYFDKLVLPYKTKQIFVYEGDNDIASGKKPQRILQGADSLLRLIRSKVSPGVEVIFISPKPSIARWELKDQYTVYNNLLKDWVKSKKNVKYADVWTPMLDPSGKVMQDLFIQDGLHMNKKGYDIWAGVIRKYIR